MAILTTTSLLNDVIGANGYHHWCHLRWGAPMGPLDGSAIGRHTRHLNGTNGDMDI
jgi:hypothetical protein